jgi:hypothetical protein
MNITWIETTEIIEYIYETDTDLLTNVPGTAPVLGWVFKTKVSRSQFLCNDRMFLVGTFGTNYFNTSGLYLSDNISDDLSRSSTSKHNGKKVKTEYIKEPLWRALYPNSKSLSRLL